MIFDSIRALSTTTALASSDIRVMVNELLSILASWAKMHSPDPATWAASDSS
jgi:hypothetical protein